MGHNFEQEHRHVGCKWRERGWRDGFHIKPGGWHVAHCSRPTSDQTISTCTTKRKILGNRFANNLHQAMEASREHKISKEHFTGKLRCDIEIAEKGPEAVTGKLRRQMKCKTISIRTTKRKILKNRFANNLHQAMKALRELNNIKRTFHRQTAL